MYKKMLRFFSNIGIKYMPSYLEPLKDVLVKSGLTILFDTYVGKMLLFSFIAFVWTLIFSFIFLLYIELDVIVVIIGSFMISMAAAFTVLTLFHTYPFQLLSAKRRNIETNLPFAINHMAAVAASGLPPYTMFKLLTDVKEYGEIAKECKKIVRNMDSFGMDVTAAIKNVADKTPSENFRKYLYGIVSVISSGGDLSKYLQEYAKEALFDYRLKREKYLSALSVYADFYIAVLIAAPLFFISIMAVMAMIGGYVFGLTIPAAIQIGTYVFIPLLNIIFLLFVHFTQPAV